MLKVNSSARIEGLHLAAMNWRGVDATIPRFTQTELDDMQKPLKFVPSEIMPGIRAFVWRQEKFARKFQKEGERVFSSDVILAYDWFMSYFASFHRIKALGITARDLGLPEDRWEEYLSGGWACPEGVQDCINIAAEMETKEGVLFLYKKLIGGLSLKGQVQYLEDFWEHNIPLSDRICLKGQEPEDEAPQEAVQEKEKPSHVTCCFTVSREVGEWLKGHRNMSRFVAGLIEEEMKNEGRG